MAEAQQVVPGDFLMQGLTVYATEDHTLHFEWVKRDTELVSDCWLKDLGPKSVRLCFHVEGEKRPCEEGGVWYGDGIALPRKLWVVEDRVELAD